MKIGAPRELAKGEARVALTPDSAKFIQKLGHDCLIESGAGVAAGFDDQAYRDAGVSVVDGAEALWSDAEVVIKVREPEESEVKHLRQGQTLISFFWPAQNEELLEKCRAQGATVVAMDMVPRISRAQKMDALSSMANIAGYRAVIEAANHFGRFFTGQVTAAGKVPPAKVLVVGAGVAGLPPIGTATSLGAVVRAFDVRPEVAEQIESMGAEFLFLDFDESQDGAESGGYAAPSSPEFREKQLECFREQAPDVDIVITTALIPGRPAPKLWLEDMVKAMKPGSVIIDLAAEKGGNCDLTVPDEKVVTDNGVTVVGYTDFPSRMATQSSLLYSTNIRHMLTDLTPEKDGQIVHDMEDDVIRGATVAHAGRDHLPAAAAQGQGDRRGQAQAQGEGADTRGEEGRRTGYLQGADQAPGDPARGGRRTDAAARPGGPGLLHAALHRLRAGLLRRLPGDLGRQPLAAYAADGGDQCHLRDHHPGGNPADRFGQRAGDADGSHLGAHGDHQYRGRLPGDTPDAGHVPEIVNRGDNPC